MPNIILVIAEDVDVISTATASYSARGSVDIAIFTSTFIDESANCPRFGHAYYTLPWAEFQA